MAEHPAPTADLTVLPTGTWRVDPNAGEVRFTSRGMWGLATVNGTFSGYDGELTVTPGGAEGELRIDAASLDTKNARRDNHLRSADFFDVEAHPTLSFTLANVSSAGTDRITGSGALRIRDNRLAITFPLTVSRHDDHLHLETSISVDRAAAGVGWSKLGMIRGDADLTVSLVLVRQD